MAKKNINSKSSSWGWKLSQWLLGAAIIGGAAAALCAFVPAVLSLYVSVFTFAAAWTPAAQVGVFGAISAGVGFGFSAIADAIVSGISSLFSRSKKQGVPAEPNTGSANKAAANDNDANELSLGHQFAQILKNSPTDKAPAQALEEQTAVHQSPLVYDFNYKATEQETAEQEKAEQEEEKIQPARSAP